MDWLTAVFDVYIDVNVAIVKQMVQNQLHANLCEFFQEHPVGRPAWHYPQPTWPILSSAMLRHKLILCIAIAVCFRPEGPGCRVC